MVLSSQCHRGGELWRLPIRLLKLNAFMSLAQNASSLKVWGLRWARLARNLSGATVVVLLT